MKKETILNNIGFVIGVLTILLIIAFKDNIVLVGIIAGIGGFLYGLCLSLNLNNSGYIFISIGLSLASSLSLYKFNILEKGDAFTFMICCSIFLLMSVSLIFGELKKKAMFKKFSLIVDAEVIDLVKEPNTKREYYQPVYGYVVDGEEFVVGALGYTNKFIPKIGDKIKLYVDPNQHDSVFFDETIFNKVYNLGLTIFLMIASLIILISLFW